MKITYWIKLIVLWVSGIAQVYAQSSPLLINAAYLVDHDSRLSLHQVQMHKNDWLNLGENQNIKYGYNTNDAIWCKIDVYNPTSQIIEKWLVFDNIYLDSITLFNANSIQLRGDRTSDEMAITIAPSFAIEIPPNDTLHLMARLKKKMSFLEFKFHLDNQYHLLRSSNSQIVFYTFVFGLISLFLLFNLILYFVAKTNIYLRYSWYVFMIITYLSIGCGFAKFCLFPSFLYFSELRIYGSFIAFSAFITFVIHYMNFQVHQKVIFRIIQISNYANWGILFLSLAFYLLNWAVLIKPTTITNYLNIIISLVVLIIGLFRSLKIQRRKALYTLSVFSVVVVWAFLFILKEITRLDFYHTIDWLFLSNIYEVTLFGVLLAIEYYGTFIANQKLMQEVIIEKERNLTALAEGEIIERKRLANILHDNFGSRLSAIKLFLNQQSQQKASAEIEVLSGDIRDLSHQIMPRSLQEGALVAALEKHIAIQNEINPTLVIELFSFDMPEKIEKGWIYDLYLISQEIINNTVKHAKASNLTIELFAYEDEFIFQFTDNGKGFEQTGEKKGIGLENMELRIKRYGGRLDINSTINEGTIISIQLPK